MSRLNRRVSCYVKRYGKGIVRASIPFVVLKQDGRRSAYYTGGERPVLVQSNDLIKIDLKGDGEKILCARFEINGVKHYLPVVTAREMTITPGERKKNPKKPGTKPFPMKKKQTPIIFYTSQQHKLMLKKKADELGIPLGHYIRRLLPKR